MTFLRRCLVLIAVALCLTVLDRSPTVAQGEPALEPLVRGLTVNGFKAREQAVQALAATGDPRAVAALEALLQGRLYQRADGTPVIVRADGDRFAVSDPLSGAALGTVPKADLDKISVNNRVRRAIKAALGGLGLLNRDPGVRARAAQAVFASRDPELLDLLDQAIAGETVPEVATALREARAAIILSGETATDRQLAAVEVLGRRGDRASLVLLGAAAQRGGDVGTAAAAAVRQVESRLAMWSAAQTVFYGLSLGSVLLLAAIGLAITFGVMGVINMAHGEMVMIGAYVTYLVQEVIRTRAPELFDYSLLLALPLAFAAAAAVGVLIERGVIRFLYGRPLETLLATWGLSLILQQAVRSIFGPTNREVATPDWMGGALELGGFTVTYNRLWIILFALVVFALLMFVMRRTPWGLSMRAVTQNRAMAASMGIRTGWVDAMTFALGSGIAGIAGVALSQIDNVSPNLGQSYIIDSFMVVVFGGVGNLWGTLVGAMTLGVANKLLEPYAGAVLAKIVLLVAIILFIQKRPRGLFALKGRAVEA